MDYPGLELRDLPASVSGAKIKDVCPFAQIYFCVRSVYKFLVFLEGLTYDTVNETLGTLDPCSLFRNIYIAGMEITENILSLSFKGGLS